MIKIAKYLLILLLVIIFTWCFLFSCTRVPDQNMSPVLHKGEIAMVNKVACGARFPMTILSVPFTDIYLDWIELPYFRLPAMGHINRSDLLVFNYPVKEDLPTDRKKVYIKRCVGLPGDIVNISGKILKVNGKEMTLPYLSYIYRIVTDGKEIPFSLLKKYKLAQPEEVIFNHVYDASMTCQKADSLKKEMGIRDVRLLIEEESNVVKCFPESDHFSWNKDDYGPLTVPRKGMSVKITTDNIDLYYKIITIYENNQVLIQNNEIFINGKETSIYSFKMDYYFMLDDNRDFANDSRNWGFLPEDHVIGKVM